MDDKLIERMVAYIRQRATERDDYGETADPEAMEIVTLMPLPIGSDVLTSIKLAETVNIEINGRPGWGFNEREFGPQCALAGIKFGRAHALSDLAKLPDDRKRALAVANQAYFNEKGLPGAYHIDSIVIDIAMAGILYGRAQLEPSRTVPPIEQDLIDAREICAMVATERQRPFEADAYRNGSLDNMPSVALALGHLQDRREP